MRRLGMTAEDLKTYPIEVGLQTDQGISYRGTLNYVSPSIDRATGTLAVRAILPNAEQVLVPGNFVRVRVGAADEQESLLVPDSALGSDQGGRYLLVLDNNNTVEQRKVTLGPRVGDLRVIESGLKPRSIRNLRPPLRRRPRARAPNSRGAMISDFFIARPVLANVLAILMIVIDGVAMFALPVAQYPDVVPPTVQVTTRYPGASARTLVDTVALPIEQQVNGVEGMIYMQSYSGADGSYSLTVTFKIGADLDIAQVLVQNRVSAALSSLPQAVQAQGVIVQKNSTAILQIVTLTSPDARYDSLYLANYATIKLKDEIARLPGVGNVVVFGAGQYSMRVWLDPNKMQARGLMPQDIIEALRQQSTQVTAGQIGAPPAPRGQTFQYTLRCRRLDTPTALRAGHHVDTEESHANRTPDRRDHPRPRTAR